MRKSHLSRHDSGPSRASPGSAARGRRRTSSGIRRAAHCVLMEPPSAKRYRRRRASDSGEGFRRALNLVIAGVSLLLLVPLILVIAIAVKLSSPGPVFFVQERVGRDKRRRTRDRPLFSRGPSGPDRRGANAGGKLFKMYKFRTMYVSHGGNEQVWALENDPRITPVGRVLRAFRLDEIPQLWNVLLGQMNVVGPRPEQPKIFRQIRSEMVDYSQRQRVLPGITGWAQINNGYDQTYRDVTLKLGYDLEYLERRSAAEDLRIMIKTVPVLLGRKVFFRG